MANANMDRQKTTVKTVRFSKSSVHSLEKEAADRSMSVNALVNSIVRQHYEWDEKSGKSGFTSIHKTVLKALVEGLDDKTLLRIGKEVVPGWFEEMAMIWFQDTSPESILNTVKLRFKFNPLMRAEITNEGNKYTIVFRHDLGPKWSILAEGAARELVRRYYHVEPRISRGESFVTGTFTANPRNSPV